MKAGMPTQTAPPTLRPVLVHMHIFKNAGTSLDEIFRPVFGEAYQAFDLDAPSARIGVGQINRFLTDHPGCRYLTSHQIGFPLPVYPARPLFPIFMLRDPYERIPSCFFFERDVQRKLSPDATLEGYLLGHLESGRVSATIGLQLLTLTDYRFLADWRLSDIDEEAVDRAMRHVSGAAVFGLVERFTDSITLFARALARHFPGVEAILERRDMRANVGAAPAEARAEARRFVRDALTAETFARLEAALRPEMALLDHARAVFDARWSRWMDAGREIAP